MPRIVAVGTAVPPHVVSQQDARDFCGEHFADSLEDLPRLLGVFEHAAVRRRYFTRSPAWLARAPSFAERNAHFVDEAAELGVEAAKLCLERAGRDPLEVGAVVFVSTTGLAAPSIDAHLIQRLGMSLNARRLPVWGLGCAGGVAGLARAAELTLTEPEGLVLLVAVETCGLTFCPEDRTKSNFIATALFGDGAGAVLVAGPKAEARGPRIVGSHSTLWPESYDIMGWDITEEGFRVKFSRDIPTIVRRYLRPVVEQFLKQHGLSPEEVAHYVSHPGGPKVLGAYAEALGLGPRQMILAREVLQEYGNTSSASVLFVLERTLEEACVSPGDYGLLLALGPGFCAEQLLIRWESQQ